MTSPYLMAAEKLCPPPSSLPEGADDLRMNENDFLFSKAKNSIMWLEVDIWEVIRSKKTTDQLLDSTEQFGIPLPNSVSRVKGVLYKQKALIEQKNLEILQLKKATPKEIKKAKERFDIAKQEFCSILEKAEYVD